MVFTKWKYHLFVMFLCYAFADSRQNHDVFHGCQFFFLRILLSYRYLKVETTHPFPSSTQFFPYFVQPLRHISFIYTYTTQYKQTIASTQHSFSVSHFWMNRALHTNHKASSSLIQAFFPLLWLLTWNVIKFSVTAFQTIFVFIVNGALNVNVNVILLLLLLFIAERKTKRKTLKLYAIIGENRRKI